MESIFLTGFVVGTVAISSVISGMFMMMNGCGRRLNKFTPKLTIIHGTPGIYRKQFAEKIYFRRDDEGAIIEYCYIGQHDNGKCETEEQCKEWFLNELNFAINNAQYDNKPHNIVVHGKFTDKELSTLVSQVLNYNLDLKLIIITSNVKQNLQQRKLIKINKPPRRYVNKPICNNNLGYEFIEYHEMGPMIWYPWNNHLKKDSSNE